VHGGLIMSLTDTLGSLAVASQGQYMTGVSTDISTSFVKPAGKPGDELKMTATLTAMGKFINRLTDGVPWQWPKQRLTFRFSGKSLAYTRIDFTNPAGQLVAYGSEFSPFVSLCVTSLTLQNVGTSPYKVRWQVNWTCGAPFFKSFLTRIFELLERRKMSNSPKMERK